MSKKTTNRINAISSTIIAIAIRVIIIGLLILVVTRGIKAAYEFGHSIFYAASVDEKPGTDKQITIPEDTDAGAVADLLEARGVIDNKIAFKVQAAFFKFDIKPGTYTLNTSMTSREILTKLDEGPEADEMLAGAEE